MRYTIKRVVLDHDLDYLRAPNPYDLKEDIKFAVYENGSLGDYYDTEKEARQCIKDIR